MADFAGKHGLIVGVANKRSISWAIAQAALRAPKLVFQSGLQRRANHLEQHVFGFFKTGVLSKLAMGRSHWNRKTSWRRAAARPCWASGPT